MKYAPIKRMLQYIYVNTIERIHIHLLDFKKYPPVFIYQMGKVGSSTVYRSLKKIKLSNPVFHIHFLTSSGIEMAEKFHKSAKRELIPCHIQLSRILRSKLSRSRNSKIKIITLVRDPISFEISNFFQNIKCINGNLIDDNGQIDKDKALSFLENKIKTYNTKTAYIDTWFDNEIKVVCNIDVFDYPFDFNKGFCTIKQKNVDLLILRLEDLNSNFSIALTDFLSLKQPVKMIKANIGKKKKYSSDYQYVKDNIKISESVCRRIYSSRFCMHFYNEKMREGFIKKWTGNI
jgi:hypothetical protein